MGKSAANLNLQQLHLLILLSVKILAQERDARQTFTNSKSTTETLEKGMKYVQN